MSLFHPVLKCTFILYCECPLGLAYYYYYLGDERSFLRDAQRSAVAVKTYGNYESLACET